MDLKDLRKDESALCLESVYSPCGDQPGAIEALDLGIKSGVRFQTLLGVTGSGKTFTVANVLARHSRPALVIAPNKTLAAQLYHEFLEFFPTNKVRYFVSYYDYYQPEAYIPSTDTYIEKDAAINEEIDKLRHAATKALIEARDVIVVASVSCIYGLGAPEEYFQHMLYLEVGEEVARDKVISKLVFMQYSRTDVDFERGKFRVRGEVIDIFPSDQNAAAIRLVFFGDEVEEILEIDSITGRTIKKLNCCAVYPLSHFVSGENAIMKARGKIREELKLRLRELKTQNRLLEAQRLEQRVLYDLELLKEIGFCPGIENYSRHITGRNAGEPPATLLDYFPKDFILVIDESHITVPQIAGMYKGDRARKKNLVEFGFRLPSALDNRPLNIDEFWQRVDQTIFVSATPTEFELEKSGKHIVEQVNRPTGLVDPEIIIKPAVSQVDDLLAEIRKTVEKQERVLVLTLTKKMAEKISDYMHDIGIRSRYIHADINAIERVELLRGLRKGDFDVLIGINLLREGLDLVEVSLVAILDADKEGFLRSTRSLIQMMGRAARNVNGRAILYADKETDSIKAAVAEAERRRKIQLEFNEKNGITPRTASKPVSKSLVAAEEVELSENELLKEFGISIPTDTKEQQRLIERLREQMLDFAKNQEFEQAAKMRDAINLIQEILVN